MKILLIDDDPIMTELLRLFLRSTGSVVFVAHSGADGIQFACEQSPDLIILDAMLPDLDGMQVCQAVREFSSIPILILSGLDTPGTISAALDAGADGYLVKPVACNILLARIDQLIQGSQKKTVPVTQQVLA